MALADDIPFSAIENRFGITEPRLKIHMKQFVPHKLNSKLFQIARTIDYLHYIDLFGEIQWKVVCQLPLFKIEIF